ncbi:MAG TPA: hypothetical protein VNG33_22205, partial [Polyangiaceae bacterium]|nr:hypothetical protein [Polyangiaceae bacterium]
MTVAAAKSERSSALAGTLAGLLGALAGASLGALLSGSIDAHSASSASGTPGLLPACLGLAAPVALPVGLGVWTFRLLFLGAEAWSPPRFWKALDEQRGSARAAWLVLPPLAALAALLGLLLVAGVSARLFGLQASGAAAFALAPLSVVPLLLSLLGGMRVLALGWGPRLEVSRYSPRLSLAASLLGFVLALGLLIALGETGGGGGALRILGVLRRPELDLRAPGLLLLMALVALLWPSPRRGAGFMLSLSCVVAPAWLTWQAARGATLPEPTLLAIERHAPLARVALGVLRKLADRDHDGVSAAFAGGDCDDHDPSVSPRAIDVPGNGKDEDCQGGDAKLVAVTAPSPDLAAAEQLARQRLPSDLNVLFVTIDTLR